MGLWMLADSKGRFEYKPRSMKLDILPFLDYSIQGTLDILEAAKFIRTYEVNGQKYGSIPTFTEHQRITGKEATEGEKFPAEPNLNSHNQQGNIGETTGKHPDAQEGKGKEGEKELGKGRGKEENSTLEFSQELSDKILKFFGFNEVANFDKLRDITAFLKCLSIGGKIDYFETQLDAYIEYKKINDSYIHTFKKFLGSHDQLFLDGAWNAENWTKKLETEKSKQHGKQSQIYPARRSASNSDGRRPFGKL